MKKLLFILFLLIPSIACATDPFRTDSVVTGSITSTTVTATTITSSSITNSGTTTTVSLAVTGSASLPVLPSLSISGTSTFAGSTVFGTTSTLKISTVPISPNPPSASVYLASDQAGTNSLMQIAFDTKNYDSQTEFTITNTGNGTGTYTAKYAGTYLITLSLQADIALGGGTGIYKNGSMIFLIPVTDAPSVRPFSRQIKLNAGDYIQIFTTLANSKKLYGSSATQQSNSIDIFRLGG